MVHLVTTIGIFPVLTRLATFQTICLCLSPVRSGRAPRSGVRLGEYEAISITLFRFDRRKTKFPVVPTTATGALGELEGHRLFTWGRWILGDMNQHEDTRTRWFVCTVVPSVIILQPVVPKFSPVPFGSTNAEEIDREMFA